jgi:hypothetical protein
MPLNHVKSYKFGVQRLPERSWTPLHDNTSRFKRSNLRIRTSLATTDNGTCDY